MTQQLFSLCEVSRLIGVPHHKITYAISSGKVPEVRRVLGRRGFAKKDIERLASCFGISLLQSEDGKGAR